MSGVNCFHAMGRLCRDPDLRTIPSGTKVCEFPIALETGWGENVKKCFIDVTVWGKQAEFVKNKFRKGDGIYIIGRIDFQQWEDKNGGGKRSKHILTAKEINFPTGSMTKNSVNNEQGDEDIDHIPF